MMMTPLQSMDRHPVIRSSVKERDSDYKSNSAFGNYNTIATSKNHNAKGLKMPLFESESARSAMRMTYSGARERA